MFDNLLRLYSSNRNKIPLEDFTTEILVGILKYDDELLKKFISDFLDLKSDRIKITTQKYYLLDNDINCIVDIVIEGDKEICFIENKVNSKEGYKQLERYSKILDEFSNKGFNTKLAYCTKVFENKKLQNHSFFHYNWHQLSQFIYLNHSEKLSLTFINYLKNNNMSTDMTIKTGDILALENLPKILSLMHRNIDNVIPEFKSKFNSFKDLRKGNSLLQQIYDQNRYCVISNPIVSGSEWSEILFGFEFKGNLCTQIYLDRKNHNYSDFRRISKEFIKTNDDFSFEEFEFGGRIFQQKNLGDFLNLDSSEEEIKNWFIDSFKRIIELIKSTKDKIEWINYVA